MSSNIDLKVNVASLLSILSAVENGQSAEDAIAHLIDQPAASQPAAAAASTYTLREDHENKVGSVKAGSVVTKTVTGKYYVGSVKVPASKVIKPAASQQPASNSDRTTAASNSGRTTAASNSGRTTAASNSGRTTADIQPAASDTDRMSPAEYLASLVSKFDVISQDTVPVPFDDNPDHNGRAFADLSESGNAVYLYIDGWCQADWNTEAKQRIQALGGKSPGKSARNKSMRGKWTVKVDKKTTGRVFTFYNCDKSLQGLVDYIFSGSNISFSS